MPGKTPLRIFISSPGDVRPERLIAENVINRLAREFASYFDIEPVLWEREPLLATEHFQSLIVPPSETEMVVVILWSQLGTLLPVEKFAGPVSGGAVTGTEWEFEDAVAGSRASGQPDILLYKKDSQVLASLDNDEVLERRRDQRRQVLKFMQRWFVDEESGSFKAASHNFESPDAFEEMLETHLRALIRQRLDLSEMDTTSADIRWHQGSPYRGLEAFEIGHASVFFGRTLARNELRAALERQIARDRAFVLVFGASGSGKSSLVKAGLLPDITMPGMVSDIGLCRYAIMRPSDAPGEPLKALSEAMFAETALPELSSLDYSVADIADQLAKAPEHVPVRQALRLAGEAATLTERASARLCVVVDQLEELFTYQEMNTETQNLFIAALQALAESGFVWVIATMRSDFFGYLESFPKLAELSDADGRFLLKPPGDAEIGQVIRQPAREAGLEFEVDPNEGIGLDETIRLAAAKSVGALPMLGFTLDQLWQQRSESGLLTFEAYKRLGGLEGALGRRAEEEFQSLPTEVQAIFPGVLRNLISAGVDLEDSVTARPALISDFEDNANAMKLIEAFSSPRARLLTIGGSGDGATVRVAHEALITHWPRAHTLVSEDRHNLLVKARLDQAAALWEAAAVDDRESLLLNAGLPLAEAVNLRDQPDWVLSQTVSDYIGISERHQAELDRTAQEKAFGERIVERNLKVVRRTAAAVLVLLLSSLFVWLGDTDQSYWQAMNNVYDIVHRIDGREHAANPVIIVDIDERAIAKYGQWPWPRSLMAKLLDSIGEAKPLSIGLFVLLPEADRSSPSNARWFGQAPQDVRKWLSARPSNDAVLARSLSKLRAVLGVAGLVTEEKTASTRPPDSIAGKITVRGPDTIAAIPHYPTLLQNVPVISDAASSWGTLNVSPDGDSVFRRVSIISRADGAMVPSITLEMLRIALGGSPLTVNMNATGVETVTIADVTVPLSSDGSLEVYLSPSDGNRYISAADIMEGSMGPHILSGKLALVGITAVGLGKLYETPAGRMHDIEFQAQILENLIADVSIIAHPYSYHAFFAYLAVILAVLFVSARFFNAILSTVVVTIVVAAPGVVEFWLWNVGHLKFGGIVWSGIACVVAVLFLVIIRAKTPAATRDVNRAFGDAAPETVNRVEA